MPQKPKYNRTSQRLTVCYYAGPENSTFLENCTPEERLISAIMARAIQDYVAAKAKLRKNPKNQEAARVLKETEAFFHSEWCYFLTGIHPDVWMKRVCGT